MVQIAKRSVLRALALCTFAAPALADPVPYGANASASAQAQGAYPPQFIESYVTMTNGVQTSQGTGQNAGGGPNNPATGTTTTSGSTYAPSVSATQIGFPTNQQQQFTTTTASVDLASGTIHLLTDPSGHEFFGSPSGSASGTIGDLVTFNNTSGSAAVLSLTFSLHGLFAPNSSADNGGARDVTANLQFYNLDGIVYPTDPVLLMNQATGTEYSISGSFWTNYIYQAQNSPYPYIGFGDNGGSSATDGSHGTIPIVLTDHSDATTLDVTQATELVVPIGISYIDIGAKVATSCDSAAQCDLSHTAILGFGPLPDGLSYTSDSGIFLTQSSSGSAVPEPSTWAMVIIGFVGLSFAAARARAAVLAG